MLFYHTTKTPDKHFVKFRFAFKIGKCAQCTMHSNPFKFMETNMKSRLFDKQYPTVEGNINNVAQEDGQILLESVCVLFVCICTCERRKDKVKQDMNHCWFHIDYLSEGKINACGANLLPSV